MNVVMGGQAGSEAKGKLSAFLVKKFDVNIVAGCLSPNAGHTAVIGGKKYVSHHIPIGSMGAIARDGDITIVLGAASVINPELLLEEIERLGIPYTSVIIDPRAIIITKWMVREEERNLVHIGSTAQGVGEARKAKLMRVDTQIRANSIRWPLGMSVLDTEFHLNTQLARGETVLYEMGQGFDLCLDHGIDPIYCTSRTINPATAFGESGVSLRYMGDVYGVIRPYPIRVNNRTGSSGPYAGAKEITWGEVGKRSGNPDFAGEVTTTTKLPRRVFEFSWSRYLKFIRVCDPTHLCLPFADYLNYQDRGATRWSQLSAETRDFVSLLNDMAGRRVVRYIGTGPEDDNMVDLHKEGL